VRSLAYASLLGDERAAAEDAATLGTLNLMAAAPDAAKGQVSAAFRRMRRTKDFGKKGSTT